MASWPLFEKKLAAFSDLLDPRRGGGVVFSSVSFFLQAEVRNPLPNPSTIKTRDFGVTGLASRARTVRCDDLAHLQPKKLGRPLPYKVAGEHGKAAASPALRTGEGSS